jgi:hypothetical protein
MDEFMEKYGVFLALGAVAAGMFWHFSRNRVPLDESGISDVKPPDGKFDVYGQEPGDVYVSPQAMENRLQMLRDEYYTDLNNLRQELQYSVGYAPYTLAEQGNYFQSNHGDVLMP